MLVPWLLFLITLGFAIAFWWWWRQANRRAEMTEHESTRFIHEREVLAEEVRRLTHIRTLLETAIPDAMLLVDQDRHITALNRAAIGLFGKAVGRSLIEVVRDADLHHTVAETLDDSRQRTMTLPLYQRIYRIQITGDTQGAALAFADVTELQRLQRARRDFVANISHELRTPLTSLGLLCNALLDAARDKASEETPLIETITAEVNALTHLVTDMLDLSQIEDGRMPLRLSPISALELIERVVSRLQPQAEQKNVALIVEAQPDLQVLADSEKIGRALTNLVDNAIKYSPHGGVVLLTTKRIANGRPDSYDIEFAVADEGPGISATDLPRVFERFFKADRARERGGGVGAGLGLAIAKHLVEAHAGRIWATSVEGHGATFYVTLPEA